MTTWSNLIKLICAVFRQHVGRHDADEFVKFDLRAMHHNHNNLKTASVQNHTTPCLKKGTCCEDASADSPHTTHSHAGNAHTPCDNLISLLCSARYHCMANVPTTTRLRWQLRACNSSALALVLNNNTHTR